MKQAFRDASGDDWVREVGEIWRASDDFGIQLAVKSGNEHVVLSPEETDAIMETLAPVTDRWIEEVSAKGIDGAALVEKARRLIAANAAR